MDSFGRTGFTGNKLIALSACLFFSEDAVNGFFSIALSVFGLSHYLSSTELTILAIYIPLFWACLLFRKRIPFDFIAVFICVVLLFIFSYDLNPQNAYFFTRDIYGIERVFRPDRAIYAYLFIRMFEDDPEGLWKTLRFVALILFVYWSLVMLNSLLRGYWEDYDENGRLIKMRYNLTFGYSILLPIVVFYLNYRDQGNKLQLVLSMIGVIEVFLAGSRGPLICIGLLFIIELLRNLRYAWAWALIFIGVFLALLIAIVGVETILLAAQDFLQSLGLSSRSLDRLISGTMTDENGRDVIWQAAVESIRNSPIFGYGVYGDRPILYQYHFAGYPHNVFLELALQFGIPFTITLIALFTPIAFRGLFIESSKRWGNAFTVFFIVSSQLLLSMSFWYVPAFWALLATAVNLIKSERAGVNDFSAKV